MLHFEFVRTKKRYMLHFEFGQKRYILQIHSNIKLKNLQIYSKAINYICKMWNDSGTDFVSRNKSIYKIFKFYI